MRLRRELPGEESATTAVLHNRTAKRIAIQGPGEGDELIIPPFGQRVLTEAELGRYAHEQWTRQRLVRLERGPAGAGAGGPWITLFPFVAGWAVLAALVFGTLWYTSGGRLLYVGLTAAASAVVAACWLGGWWISKTSGEVAGRMARSLNIFLVIVLGAGINVSEILYEQERTGFAFGANAYLLLLFLVPAASILPAALFFWFHRQKMPVVREGFLRDIVRLDPNVQTLDDADLAYRDLIDDVYGPDPKHAGGGSARVTGVAWGGLPVVITTLLFAVLWNWTLLSPMERSADRLIRHRQDAAAAFGLRGYAASDGAPRVPGYSEEGLNTASLLTPNTDVVAYAFLGSYFFALGMLFRRYTRSDLTPKAYTHVCVRLITAVVTAWVVSRVPFLRTDGGDPNATMLLLAFVIGIVPETGTAVIQDVLRKTPGLGKAVPSLQEDHPLAVLDGISLYDRSQLLEVGIENVESLAHNNLIELRLWTRIPTSRLVDFVDQAVLFLHIRGGAGLDGDRPFEERNHGALELLGAYGVRTATDLERAHASACTRATEEAFLGLLGGASGVPRLRVVLDAMADDEWMVYLRNWRNSSVPHPPLRSVDDFVDQARAETSSATAAGGYASAGRDGDGGNLGEVGDAGEVSPAAAPDPAAPTRLRAAAPPR